MFDAAPFSYGGAAFFPTGHMNRLEKIHSIQAILLLALVLTQAFGSCGGSNPLPIPQPNPTPAVSKTKLLVLIVFDPFLTPGPPYPWSDPVLAQSLSANGHELVADERGSIRNSEYQQKVWQQLLIKSGGLPALVLFPHDTVTVEAAEIGKLPVGTSAILKAVADRASK